MAARKQRGEGLHRHWLDFSFSLFIPFMPPLMGWYCPHSRWVFSPQLALFGKSFTDTARGVLH
jgi:hypothetical protein